MKKILLSLFIIHSFLLNGFAQEIRLGLPVTHNTSIVSCAFSPDGKYAVTSSTDKTAIIWDISTGKAIHILTGHTELLNGAEFSPDGKVVITSSYDRSFRLWDVATGKEIFNIKGSGFTKLAYEKAINIINPSIFSPDGKEVICICNDSTAKKFRIEDGKQIFTINYQNVYLNSAIFSHDGKYILTSSDDSIARLYDAEKGNLVKSLPVQNHKLKYAFFSPDDEKIVQITKSDTLTIWNTISGKLSAMLTMKGYKFKSAQFSPDGKKLYTLGEYSDIAIIWDVTSGRLLKSMNCCSRYSIKSFVLSSDEKTFVTNGHPFMIRDGKSGDFIDSIFVGENDFDDIAISPKGDKILIATGEHTLKLLDVKSRKTIFETQDRAERLSNADFNTGNKNILTKSYNFGATVWDAFTGKPKIKMPAKDWLFTAKFSPDGKRLITILDDSTAKLWDVSTSKLISVITVTGSKIYDAEFSNSGNFLYTTSSNNAKFYGNTIKIWDGNTGKYICDLEGRPLIVSDVMFSLDDKVIVARYSSYDHNVIARLWDVGTGKLISVIRENSSEMSEVSLSPDGMKLFTNRLGKTSSIWDSHNGKLLYSINDSLLAINGTFSPDGKYLATSNVFGMVKIYDGSTGKFLFSINADANTVVFSLAYSSDSKYIITASYKDNCILIWDASNGKVLRKIANNTQIKKIQFTPDSKRIIALLDNDSIKAWNTEKGNLLYCIRGTGHSLSTSFDKDFTRIIRSSIDGSIYIWDAVTGKMVIRQIVFNDNQFVVLTDDGLFDASPEVMEKMFWVKGSEIIDFNQLKERYWEPGLWEKTMKGEKLRDVRGMNELKLQPEVELAEIKDGKLPISLTKRDGGYGRVVVMINGKEVEADARGNGFDTTKAEQTLLYDLKDNPLLEKGKENTITVKSWSADGFVEGRGITVNYKPKGDSVSSPPSLFAVVLGISEYSSSAIHLNYAKPDATAIATAIKLGGENLFGKEKTFVYLLTSPGDIKPTKENIRKVFFEIKGMAKPSDIFVLYMSGHGITWGGASGDFYYLTTDAFSSSAEAYNDPAIRKNNTISTNEFTEWINEIPALKQVMIIDACGSGKAVDNLLAKRDVNASQIKSIDRMKDRTGMFIISGCAADAVSYEASRYGQGLLTYTILQAIKGAALREDKFIDVNTILNYSREKVPELAAGVGGIQQPQILIPKGGSFDIGLIDDVSRVKIPLANPKPLFVRSNFIDVDQLEDVIGLSKKVDESLNSISLKGTESKIIFIDTREYPDGCKISGTYTQKDGVIKLRFKIKCAETINEFQTESQSIEEIIKTINEKVLK